MSRIDSVAGLVVWLGWLAGTAVAQQAPPAALAPDEPVAGALAVDTDGDGRAELVVATVDGRLLRFAADGGGWTRRGSVRLADPVHTLWTAADVLPRAGEEVLVADGSGIGCVVWPDGDTEGDAVVEPLVRRARNRLRVDRPTVAPFADDLNHDGRPDLLLPTLGGVIPYLQEASDANGAPAFRAMPMLPVAVQVEVGDREPGSDPERTAELRIAQIATFDLNADGRPDLLTRESTRHAFHLQKEDGSFHAPIEVDIKEFEDSTPKAAIAPGETVVLGDRQMLQRGDVDGDGIADFVIAHRRKIWTFLGGKDGPQFTKAKVQAVAEDVSAFLVVDLDGDEKADLLTFQVQLPGVAALLLGLIQSIDIDIRAVGYRSEGGAFAGAPQWRRTLTLRIPPLLSLLGKQEELLAKFNAVVSKARLGVRGSFTGAARRDLALIAKDGKSVELHPRKNDGPTLSTAGGRELMRRLLFEDPNTLFDLDRILAIVSGLLEERAGELVGDEKPTATMPLRDAAEWRVVDLLTGDFLGVGRESLVVVYERAESDDRPARVGPLRAFERMDWPVPGK
ncbi:MAG: hypothetical protein RL398_2992 [Planctomycetota bacterium]